MSITKYLKCPVKNIFKQFNKYNSLDKTGPGNKYWHVLISKAVSLFPLSVLLLA